MKKRSFAQIANQFDMLEEKQEEQLEEKPEEKQEESQAVPLQPEEKQEEKEKDHQPELNQADGLEEEEIDYLAEFKKKPNKVKETFDIDKELHRELKALSRKYGYGFKTKFINSAIKRELERIKKLERRG